MPLLLMALESPKKLLFRPEIYYQQIRMGWKILGVGQHEVLPLDEGNTDPLVVTKSYCSA